MCHFYHKEYFETKPTKICEFSDTKFIEPPTTGDLMIWHKFVTSLNLKVGLHGDITTPVTSLLKDHLGICPLTLQLNDETVVCIINIALYALHNISLWLISMLQS